MSNKGYRKLAADILECVGGKSNISNCMHCMTRLRFTLKDESLADKDKLGSLDGVLGCKTGGGQVQVIIGNAVGDVYEQVCSLAGIQMSDAIDEKLDDTPEISGSKSLWQRFLDYITNAFIPMVPALVGSGMLKGFLSLFTTLGWMDSASGGYAVLSAAGNAVFYFIPFLVAYNTAKYLKTNIILALVTVGALMEPNFTALIDSETATTFFGIPLTAISYASLILPALVIVPVQAQLEKLLKKFVPKVVQVLFVPFICIVIMVPLSVLVLGPVTNMLTELITTAITWLNDTNAVLLGVIVGGTVGYLTMLGLHMAFVPIVLLNFTNLGSDSILAFMSATCYAQVGIALAIWLRSKDPQMKSLAGASGITALLSGVTEPILFGLCVKYKKSYPVLGIAGAVGGGLMGLFGCKAMGFVNAGILGISGYFSDTFPMYVVSIAVTTILAFVLMALVFKKEGKS